MAETHLNQSGTAGTQNGTQIDTSPRADNEATDLLDISQEGLKTQSQIGSVSSTLVHQRDQS